MKSGVLATKMGMTQIFTEEGVCIPSTVLKITPNTVVSKKTKEKDGYTATQLGMGAIREKVINKAKLGHFAKNEVKPVRHLREFRGDNELLANVEIGGEVGLNLFADVASVDVFGTSKGCGFAGVMKRHNFGGFRATHGTHEVFRHGGSIGCRAQPGKVFKGQKMAGQMGNERVCVQNLRVVGTDEEDNLLFVRGAVPGPKGSVLEVCISSRKPKAIPGISADIAEIASKNPMKASKAGR